VEKERENNKFYSPKNDIDTDERPPEIKGPPRR